MVVLDTLGLGTELTPFARSAVGLGRSLIPGVVVKLSRILAGPMVLSAVGARTPSA
jgi:hypothetical protein